MRNMVRITITFKGGLLPEYETILVEEKYLHSLGNFVSNQISVVKIESCEENTDTYGNKNIEEIRCPDCGSIDVALELNQGKSSAVNPFIKYVCKNCGFVFFKENKITEEK